MKVETGVLSSWWKIQRNDHLVGFDWDSHEVAEVGEARLGSGFEEVFMEESLDGLRGNVVQVVKKMEKASFLVFVPFFVKHQVLLVSKCSGKGCLESLGWVAMVAEANK
jgi:hypothetical protein